MHKLHNLRLRTAFLAHLLFLGPADDTVEGLLGQWTKIRLIVCRLGREFHLSVQHIVTEEVVVIKKQLDGERRFERGAHSPSHDKILLTHSDIVDNKLLP